TGEACQNRVIFKQLFQAGAIKFCQIDSCRLGGVNEILAVMLMAAKYGVAICPHGGGVGLCEFVQHLSVLDYICIGASLQDRILGLTVPQVRSLIRGHHPADDATVKALLASAWHEERLLGLLLLVERHRRGTEADRERAYRLYVKSFSRVNNWDLVDSSAEYLVGPQNVGLKQLRAWAASPNLWVRHIAIVSTFHSVRP